MNAAAIQAGIKAIEESRSLVTRMRARQPNVHWSLDSYFSETHAALKGLRELEAAPPAPAAVAVSATAEMVRAYLQAHDDYWRESDAEPRAKPVWRNGMDFEATRIGIDAALAAAPAQDLQPTPAPAQTPCASPDCTFPHCLDGLAAIEEAGSAVKKCSQDLTAKVAEFVAGATRSTKDGAA